MKSVPAGFDGLVAWTMFDGNVMTGRVESTGYDNCYVKRIDGSVVTVKIVKLRPATESDFNASVEFFRNIGK